jgi:divalent anion:Na+ symporter, DASS family
MAPVQTTRESGIGNRESAFEPPPSPLQEPQSTPSARSPFPWLKWVAIVASAAIVLAFPVPNGIKPESWRLLAIFIATIVGSILRPLPAGAVVLIGVCALALTNALTPAQALGGYADPIVWLVLCAFFISRGVTKTGLGRRIAFVFIRAIGHRSIGLAYALVATDTLLATLVPSNSARAGGVVFPITKSLAEAYESHPGERARRLGSYLMTVVYQCDVVACAMFLTGQASNVIIAKLAQTTGGVDLSYTRWLVGGIVPGLLTLAILPLVLFKLYPPEVTKTPNAAAFASDELRRLGPMSRNEKLMLFVFALTAGLWMTTKLHQINYAVVALLGVCTLMITGVLSFDDVIGEHQGWGVFLWYGGLVQMAASLGESGLTKRFAEVSAGYTVGWSWGAALVVLLLVYFYAHYGFASITAHATAMFTPFLAVTIGAGAPAALAALSLAYVSNLAASLTHYGTTTAPIYFGAGYVTQRAWWRLGFIVSLVSLGIWGTLGPVWWKVLGWW